MANPTIILITGANQGLGYYACEILARRGNYTILLGSRDLGKGQKAVKKILQEPGIDSTITIIEPIQIDLSSDESIQRAAEFVRERYGKLDILVNNAGYSEQREQTEGGPSWRKIYHEQLDTNLVGHEIVTEKFLPLLRKSTAGGPSPRIVFTTSNMGSLAMASEGPSNPVNCRYMLYRTTKSALNMLAVIYANILREEGITVVMVCPGYCATNLTNYAGVEDPRSGAKAIVDAATVGTHADTTGTWVSNTGIVPW
ncbi:hypothetical protein GX50_01624 [[Emmonsia] crescens]|uniref:NAD(P)-binding protein n=1 Tax=[Emmonsia] crescens TaxID=73230 RepID=A0A2B7ZR96_9EURO|nr:hypothetical protein GX50_01624 [Emmonsia crescens]